MRQDLRHTSFLRLSFAAALLPLVCGGFISPNSTAADQAAAQSTSQHAANSAQNSWTGFGHNRRWTSKLDISERLHLQTEWQQTVGEGYSQIVGNESTVYVTSGSATKIAGTKSKKLETILTARSIDTGKQLWKFRTESVMTSDQETFGGNKPSPRSTPLLVGNRIIFWTFTGELFCLNAATGKQVWLSEPVTQLDAQKVQFGFSSSPVLCPDDATQFVVLAAGKRGGLIRMSVETGKPTWISPVATFSYATPVFARLNGTEQWIVVSRDEVAGIDHADGSQLWRFGLKETGLTNVPSPLVVDDSAIVISGQGMKGTQCINIQRTGKKWAAKERWSSRVQFFYTNWLMMDDSVMLGCTEQYMTAFDCADGTQLGRWRGFGDGNVTKIGDRFAVINKQGQLSVMSWDRRSSQLVVGNRYQLGKGRFWAGATLIGERLLVRFDDRLHCYSFNRTASKNDLTNEITKNAEPRLQLVRNTASKAASQPDPVEAIFAEFQKNGQQAALKLYTTLRQQKKLSPQQRISIAESAYGQGLKQVAVLVMKHAQQDFPNSTAIKKKLAEWSR